MQVFRLIFSTVCPPPLQPRLSTPDISILSDAMTSLPVVVLDSSAGFFPASSVTLQTRRAAHCLIDSR
jgi:hypothetical protein